MINIERVPWVNKGWEPLIALLEMVACACLLRNPAEKKPIDLCEVQIYWTTGNSLTSPGKTTQFQSL